MNKIRLALTTMLAAGAIACGGEEAPAPAEEAPAPVEEAPAVPEGVTGNAPRATLGTPSVVTLRPSEDGDAVMPSEAAVMDQLGLAFTPTTLLVRPGQPLRFLNSEALAHNVHVSFMDSDSTVFLADMDPDAQTEITLELEGGYDVTCDVHPGMRAFIYVTSAPHAVFAEQDGSFAMPDVPPGSYTASVWSASPELRGERPVEVSGVSTELDLTSF